MEEGEKASVCRYIGLDIHKYYSVVAGVDRDGEEIVFPCRVEHAELESWLAKHLLSTDWVVIETTTNAEAFLIQFPLPPLTLRLIGGPHLLLDF
jgi:hypothetical protein